MNVDTSNGILVNNVIGSDISQLLGTLTQTGSNRMYLINPNGIVVGSSAVINADNLLLSSLGSNYDWSALSDNSNEEQKEGLMWKKADNATPASVVFNSGAQVNGEIKVYASAIEVAEGVVFTAPDDANLQFMAADSITDNDSTIRTINDSTNAGTTVKFAGTVNGSEKVTIVGTDVTFSGNINQADKNNNGQAINGVIRVIGADKVVLNSDAANGTSEFKSAIEEVPNQYSSVTLAEGSRLHGMNSAINVLGGKVAADGNVHGKTVGIYAEKTADTYGADNMLTIGDKANIKSESGSTILRANAITSSGNLEGTVDSNVNIVVPNPTPDIIVDDASFAAGEEVTEAIIKESADKAAIQDNLAKVAKELNKLDQAPDKKASMVAGMISAIGAQKDEGKLDNAYGAVRAVLDNYEGTGKDTEASENALKSDGDMKAPETVSEAPLAGNANEAETADVTFE